jgi:hypothetical protein
MPTIDVSVKVNITNGDQMDLAEYGALAAYREGQIDTGSFVRC